MADPFTIAAASTAASGGGSILSAIGGSQKASAEAGMYRYQAGIADLNKKIALQNADWELATGEKQAENYGLRAAQQRGQIVAGKAASGLDVGSGSASDVVSGQETATRIDLGTIRSNAAHLAYGFDVQAAQAEAQKGAYEAAAQGAEQAGKLAVISSLVGGVSTVASKWLQGQQAGIWSGSKTASTSGDSVTSQGYDASWYS